MSDFVKVQLVLLALLIVYSTSEKVELDRPFRANKLNLIWNKLQNKMSSNKLEDLKRALSDQDEREMNWKELKLHGGDADGEIEADLRQTLFKILEKYGQEELFGKAPEPKAEPGTSENTIRSGENSEFSDTRLQKLWKLAKRHGKFDDKEMNQLRSEFEHHKQKIDEYNILLRTLQDHHEISENSVRNQDKLDEHKLEKLKYELKDKYVEMKKNYKFLRERVTGEVVQSPFKDYRVIELWEKAKANNFSPEELESIKEELTHFENKIGKHEHFRNAAKKAETKMGSGHDINNEVYMEYIKKSKEHMKYVKKLHHTLLEKVSKRDEL